MARMESRQQPRLAFAEFCATSPASTVGGRSEPCVPGPPRAASVRLHTRWLRVGGLQRQRAKRSESAPQGIIADVPHADGLQLYASAAHELPPGCPSRGVLD